MAARVMTASELTGVVLRDLRELRADSLNELLDEEGTFWREELAWDFESSASLVTKFVEIQALNGYAAIFGRRVVGYCYYVFEDHKGMIGDLYVARDFRSAGNLELQLLGAALDDLRASREVRRIEAQLMTFTGPMPERDPRFVAHLKTIPRDFLFAGLPLARRAEPRDLPERINIVPWRERHQEGAAHLVRDVYRGHVDSEINDQYRTLPGARKFLYNIIQFPGCGTFLQAGSLVALDTQTSAVVGTCLTSTVGPGAAHITQICVSKDWQGCALGYELLRQSMELLREQGMGTVSLTVTSGNKQAMGLYERLGFRKTRHFCAYVWEGF
jgi:ribosomal protein S18 acetylase RimI-like enzyme